MSPVVMSWLESLPWPRLSFHTTGWRQMRAQASGTAAPHYMLGIGHVPFLQQQPSLTRLPLQHAW